MKKSLISLSLLALLATPVVVSANPLPEQVVRDGKVFNAIHSEFDNVAIPDKANLRDYVVTGSDVRKYEEANPHGQGPEHYASGWVSATAPRFYCRVTLDYLDSSEQYNRTGENTAYASTVLGGYLPNATPRLYYGW